MALPLPSPAGETLPSCPSFRWLSPCFHLETLLPLSLERDGWLRHERLLRRLLSAVGLASDLHSRVLDFLHPGSFCHAFVPVAVPAPSPHLLIPGSTANCQRPSDFQSCFGGDSFLSPEGGGAWPRCEADTADEAPGCGRCLTLLFQLRVDDLPTPVAAVVRPRSAASSSDTLQCFVCLHCHVSVQSHPLPHCTRWMESPRPRPTPPTPSAAFIVELSSRLKGSEVIAQLRRLDVQPSFTEVTMAGQCDPAFPVVLPRMRLSHWLRIPTRPSRFAEAEALGLDEVGLRKALKEERSQWGRNTVVPHVLRMGGYEVHRTAVTQQRCTRSVKGAWGPVECSQRMHLLLTFPSRRLLPVAWHLGHDLWIYQCPVHRDHFALRASN